MAGPDGLLAVLTVCPVIRYKAPIMAITSITNTASTTTSQLCIDFLIGMAHLLTLADHPSKRQSNHQNNE
jgi:hypothetical protein